MVGVLGEPANEMPPARPLTCPSRGGPPERAQELRPNLPEAPAPRRRSILTAPIAPDTPSLSNEELARRLAEVADRLEAEEANPSASALTGRGRRRCAGWASR